MSLDRRQHNNPQRIQEYPVMQIVFRNMPSAGGSETGPCFRKILHKLDESSHSSRAGASAFLAISLKPF
jgi:hypothetical protein